MSGPMLHHRGPDFRAVLGRVLDRLPQVFRTTADVVLFASSGSGAMEAAVANACSPGDRVLVASAGYFGERWAAIADRLRARRRPPAARLGRDARPRTRSPTRLREAGGARAVYVTHSETSTGVVNDVEAIAASSRRARARCSSWTPSRASAPCRSRPTRGGSTSSSPAPRRRSWRRRGSRCVALAAALGGARDRHVAALLARLGTRPRLRSDPGRDADPGARRVARPDPRARASRSGTNSTCGSAAPPARARRRWASSSSPRTRTARQSSPRSACPTAWTARRSCGRCATTPV